MVSLNYQQLREKLIDNELRLLGIRNQDVLDALKQVPREEFVAENLREFAYRNAPLPIGAGQTISQPLIVAHMTEALELGPNDRVLEVGAGSGYAAAVLSQIAKEVYTIERIGELATAARERLQRLGYANVEVRHGDGSQGWPGKAPFDAIIVAAGGPGVPSALLNQLKVGGRLIMPVGERADAQRLVRVVRRGQADFEYEELGAVRFVPLIGEAAWPETEPVEYHARQGKPPVVEKRLSDRIREAAEPISSVDDPDITSLLNRIGDARVVLIGEATHGSSEFYRIRAAITKALIEKLDFDFVAVEADWPDAYCIHDFVTHRRREEPRRWEAFARFPTWMWRNHEVLDFIHWLRDFNLKHESPKHRVGFFGLDIYSMFTSIHRVIEYLDRVDQEASAIARARYGCLTPWESDPASYGQAAITGRYRKCEKEVVHMLKDLMERRLLDAQLNGDELLDAQMNARVVASAEQYYRVMYYGSDESWNLRDTHMFETLQQLLHRKGNTSKAVIWAHNSHIGNAVATQFGKHGQLNIGQLCREKFGREAYLIGQGTDHGTVAAASNWEGAMQVMQINPSHPDSYERVMHDAGLEAFFLPLSQSAHPDVVKSLADRRLERAIGVIYRPKSERLSHYFDACLPEQFDELIWIDQTSPVRVLTTQQAEEHEPQHPFASFDR